MNHHHYPGGVAWCACCGSGPTQTSVLLCAPCAADCAVCRGAVAMADVSRDDKLCRRHDKALQRAQLDRHPFYGPLYRDIEAGNKEAHNG